VRAVPRTVFPAITVRRVGEDYHLDPGEPRDLRSCWAATLVAVPQ
jgi:hypothetical protein